MKLKQIVFTALCMILSTTVWSQTSFGVRTGVNFASAQFVTDGVKLSSTTKAGLNIGVFANFALKERLSLQPELSFSQMGTKLEDIDEESQTLNYISLPVMAKYAINNWGIFAGPQLSFLTSAKAKYEGETESISEYYKSTDFSLVFGTDYSISKKLFVGARYQLGVTNIGVEPKDEYEYEYDQPTNKMRNRNFTLSIGYSF